MPSQIRAYGLLLCSNINWVAVCACVLLVQHLLCALGVFVRRAHQQGRCLLPPVPYRLALYFAGIALAFRDVAVSDV